MPEEFKVPGVYSNTYSSTNGPQGIQFEIRKVVETYNNAILNKVDSLDRNLNDTSAKVEENNLRETWNAINVLFPLHGLSPAKGDGVSDDTATINTIIQWAYNNGFKNVFLPPTENGYFIQGELLLKGNMRIFGNNTKLLSPVYNAEIPIDLFRVSYQEGYIEIDGFIANSPDNSIVNFLHVGGSTGNITLKNCYTYGYHFFVKIDANNDIDNILIENVTSKNLYMGFLFNNIKNIVIRNATTHLRYVTKLEHHYYFSKDVQDITLDNIRAYGSAGSLFQFNANGESQSVNPSFVANNVIAYNIPRLFSSTYNLRRACINNIHIENFVRDEIEPLDLIYLGVNVTDIDLKIDGFYFKNPPNIVLRAPGISNNVKLSFLNGKFGRFMEEPYLGDINELNLINVEFENIIHGYTNNAPVSSSTLFLMIPKNSVNKLNLIVRDVKLNIVTNGLSNIQSNYHILRIEKDGEYVFDNIILKSDNENFATNGRFFYYPTQLTDATIKFINCDIRATGRFENAGEAESGKIPYYYKTNTYFKRTQA